MPPLYDVVVSPPNSISDTLLQMIQHPLRLMSSAVNPIDSHTNISNCDDSAFTSSSLPLISEECAALILSSFVDEILVPEYTKPIRLFVIPCLANSDEFPFTHLLQYLSDLIKKECSAEQHQSGPMSAQSNHDEYHTSSTSMALARRRINAIDSVFSSSYVFHSILTLNRLHLERIRNNPVWVGNYINVLGSLSRNIRKLQQRSSNPLLRQYDMEFEADDDSDTDEEIDRTIQSISTMAERECLSEVISQLNDEKHVEVMLNNIDNYLDDVHVLYSLCKICHNLMLYHRTAVFDFQYVFFFPLRFIHRAHIINIIESFLCSPEILVFYVC